MDRLRWTNRRLLAGIVVAAVVAAVTATSVVVIAQQGHDQPLIGPSKALRPSEITKIPPGTPAVGLTEPVDHGRFRILPSNVALPPPCGVTAPPGAEQERVEREDSVDLAKLRQHDLFIVPPYMPAGWEARGARTETVVWTDGSHTDSIFEVIFERDEYFPILIGRRALAPKCKVERVEYQPEGQHAFTLGEIRGVPVLYLHQAPGEKIQADLWVEFVLNDVVTRVSSIAIDFDELIQIADNLIQLQMGLIEAPPIPTPVPGAETQSQGKESLGAESGSSLTIDTVAIDMDVDKAPFNTATRLGTRQACNTLAVGGTLEVDVTVDAVPPDNGSDGAIRVFQFTLSYDPSKVRIVASDHNMLLSANAGSSLTGLGDSVPDEDGSFLVAVADFGYPTVPEEGEGVLARITLEGVAAGVGDLALEEVIVDGIATEPYAIGEVLGAQVAVGTSCP